MSLWSIRRYLVALVLAAGLPLVGLLGYTMYESYQRAIQDAEEVAHRYADVVAADTQRYVEYSRDVLEGLARRPLVRAVNERECDPILSDFKDFFPRLANVAMADREGYVTCSALAIKADGTRRSVGNSEWFTQVRQEPRFHAGKPHIGPVSGKWVAVLAQPLIDDHGKFNGVIGFPVNLSDYDPIPTGVTLPAGMVISLVNSDGTVVMRSTDRAEWIGKSLGDPEVSRRLPNPVRGGKLVGSGVDERLIALAPVTGSTWTSVVIWPTSQALAGLWLSAHLKLTGAVGLIALSLLVAVYMGRRIVRPVSSIANVANRVAQGDTQHRAEENGPVEIAAVARQMNQMLDIRLQAEARYRNLVESASDGIVVVNADSCIVLVNAQAERAFGYEPGELHGQQLDILLPPEIRSQHQRHVDMMVREAGQRRAVGRVIHGLRKDGSLISCEIGFSSIQTAEGVLVSATIRDLSEHLKLQNQLDYLSQFDALTGLPNRTLLRDRLNQAIARANRAESSFALLLLDIDHFKETNDYHGAAEADHLLKQVAEHLRVGIREMDTVARVGSDEFVIIVDDLPNSDQLLSYVDRLRFIDDAGEIKPSLCVGAAFYPSDGQNIDELLKNVDLALIQAKREGSGSLCYFERAMDDRAAQRQRSIRHLRQALERNEFELHYQPQVDTASGQIVGVEALIRWDNPVLGRVPPSDFIPLAEETGLIEAIGLWVLRTACAQNRTWRDRGLPAIVMAINLSAKQFRQRNIIDQVQQVLRETGLDPAAVELEITESMLMDDPDGAAEILLQLDALGLKLAIHEFGTG